MGVETKRSIGIHAPIERVIQDRIAQPREMTAYLMAKTTPKPQFELDAIPKLACFGDFSLVRPPLIQR
jgi:hypothetical protein